MDDEDLVAIFEHNGIPVTLVGRESEAYKTGRSVGVALFKSGTPKHKCADVRQGALERPRRAVGQHQALGEIRPSAQQPGRHGPAHRPCADQADAAGPAAQYWLKKPFSSRRARSSAEISTLRGVSMKTLSATRCIPPSRA